jgi:hypothetical protein
MTLAPGLDMGLLVGRDHELVGAKAPALVAAAIQIEDQSRLVGEERTRKDPAPERPGADGVVGEPPPDGGCPRSSPGPPDHLRPDFRDLQAGQGQPQRRRELAGDGLTSTSSSGERQQDGPCGSAPEDRPGAPPGSA